MFTSIFRKSSKLLGSFNHLKTQNYKALNTISFLKKQKESQELQQNANQSQQLNQELEKPTQDIVEDSVQELLQQQREQEEEHQREIELMHQKHNELSTQVKKEMDIPFKLYGWLEVPETTTAYMGERVFAQNRIPKHKVLDHLYKIFTGTLYSMCEQDEEFLYEYCEKQFADKMLKSMSQLKEKGYNFRVIEDITGIGGEPVSKFYYISDMVMVRGLNTDREKNLSRKEYHEFKDTDDMGIVIYTPQYISQPESFIDPERNKTIFEEDYNQVIMRALVPIRTPLRLQAFRPAEQQENGEFGEEVIVDEDLYTWEHLAIFETQMIKPEKFESFYKQENYMEWLGKFKFGTWKMVDLDNWMQGNPLIIKDSERSKYDDPIFKGTKYDPEHHIDIKNV